MCNNLMIYFVFYNIVCVVLCDSIVFKYNSGSRRC